MRARESQRRQRRASGVGHAGGTPARLLQSSRSKLKAVGEESAFGKRIHYTI